MKPPLVLNTSSSAISLTPSWYLRWYQSLNLDPCIPQHHASLFKLSLMHFQAVMLWWGCHAQYMKNMGSIASSVITIIINGNGEDAVGIESHSSMTLLGLLVCHNTFARCIPFRLRYACEFSCRPLRLQMNMELQPVVQSLEKQVLRTQTLLCNMPLRDSPTGIVKGSGAAVTMGTKAEVYATTFNETLVCSMVFFSS